MDEDWEWYCHMPYRERFPCNIVVFLGLGADQFHQEISWRILWFQIKTWSSECSSKQSMISTMRMTTRNEWMNTTYSNGSWELCESTCALATRSTPRFNVVFLEALVSFYYTTSVTRRTSYLTTGDMAEMMEEQMPDVEEELLDMPRMISSLSNLYVRDSSRAGLISKDASRYCQKQP